MSAEEKSLNENLYGVHKEAIKKHHAFEKCLHQAMKSYHQQQMWEKLEEVVKKATEREKNERLKMGILKVRDELFKGDIFSAYHELYRLADPTFEKIEPWSEFEQLLKEQQ